MSLTEKGGKPQPILAAVAEGAGVTPDQNAHSGWRLGAPEAYGLTVAGRPAPQIDRRRWQGDEMVGQLGQALQGDYDEPDVLWREPPQAAAEDVGSAQQLRRGRVGCQ